MPCLGRTRCQNSGFCLLRVSIRFCFTIRGIPSAYHGRHTIRLHAGCTKRKRRGRDPIALLWRGVNTSGSRDNRYGKCIVGLNLEPAACFRAIRKPPRNAPRLPIQTNNRATSEPHTHVMSNENKFPSKTGSSTPSPERAQEPAAGASILPQGRRRAEDGTQRGQSKQAKTCRGPPSIS